MNPGVTGTIPLSVEIIPTGDCSRHLQPSHRRPSPSSVVIARTAKYHGKHETEVGGKFGKVNALETIDRRNLAGMRETFTLITRDSQLPGPGGNAIKRQSCKGSFRGYKSFGFLPSCSYHSLDLIAEWLILWI